MKAVAIPANNLCKLIWERLLEWIDGKEICLVGEPDAVLPIFKQYHPDSNFTILNYHKLDLNKRNQHYKQYDSVFCQAIIEHVCRPSMAVENLANLTRVGGVIAIYTCKPGFQVHRYPIDCVRFLPDFWVDLCRYLPIELCEYEEDGFHVFVKYRRKE